MGKKTVLKLDIDYDFNLLALATSEKDYRVCWFLNKVLHFSLIKVKDIELHIKNKKKITYFSHYQYTSDIDKRNYSLIFNKSLGEYLIPEVKEADCFLKIDGYITQDEIENLLATIKELNIIQAIFKLDINTLKSKQNLILDEYYF